MAFRLVAQPLRRVLATRASSSAATSAPKSEQEIYADKIGTREIVGFGFNGFPAYADRTDYPFPAIRYREDTPEIKKLRLKEKEDWKKLTKQEKKVLYRASFCQTFAEFKAPTGEWKCIVAAGLLTLTIALWFSIWLRLNIYDPLPPSFSEEGRKAQLKRMLDLEVGIVDGLSSKWDYENKRWK